MLTRKKQLNLGLGNVKEGGQFKIVGFDTGISKQYGEFNIITMMTVGDETVRNYVMDSGLKGALKLAGIITETTKNVFQVVKSIPLEIEYKGTIQLDSGFECNEYCIYELE